MTITAKILADSVGPLGTRLTTWELRYPRFIHAELMTHRALSRNAGSSRAIPVKRMNARIAADPATPVEWGANKPGMQASEVIRPEEEAQAKVLWAAGCAEALKVSAALDGLNVHKQIVNRVAEPWAHIAVVASGTEFANFFTLRHHPMAQPEFQALAALMADVYRGTSPRGLGPNEWHLPYVTDAERAALSIDDAIRCSVARCARVSYDNSDGTPPTLASDLALYLRLVGGKPLHASPTEHQATPFYDWAKANPGASIHSVLQEAQPRWGHPYDTRWKDPVPWSANFRGFFQYRQLLKGQNVTTLPWEADAP